MVEYIFGTGIVVAGLTYFITKKTSKNNIFTLTSDNKKNNDKLNPSSIIISKIPKPPLPRFVREDTADKIPPKQKTIQTPIISKLDLIGITGIRLEGSAEIAISRDTLLCDNYTDVQIHNTTLWIKTISHVNVNGQIYMNTINGDITIDGIPSKSKSEKFIKLINFSSGLDINRISLQGSGTITLDSLSFNHDLDVVLQGSGDINFLGCEMYEAYMTLNGSGDIHLDSSCTANTLILKVQGSGDITINNGCKVKGIQKSILGSGDINILTKDYKKL